jgi:hypothetical protein
MAEGRDYVTGTAVGAPFVLILAAIAGLFVGAAFYSLNVRSRLWTQARQAFRQACGRSVSSRRAQIPSSFTAEHCAAAAASGGAA